MKKTAKTTAPKAAARKTAVSRSAASTRSKATTSRARVTAASRKRVGNSKRVVSTKAPLRTRARVHAKSVLVPQKENEYRPHLIRLHGLVAVLVIALLAQVFYGFVTTGHWSVLGRTSNIETSQLLTDTNAERIAAGVGEVHLNEDLSQAAFLKAQNMFAEQYWAHVSPSGTQPWKWFGDVGYNYSYAGENLAKNYPTAQATVDAWMNSPTHRENVLNDHYVDIGFAVVDGELNGQNTTLVVALYGAPVTVAAAVDGATTSAPRPGFMAPAVASNTGNPLAYFGTALETLSPVTIAILGLLAIVAIVGVAAHHYRKSLPKSWQRSWRKHHGIYTFVGMIGLGVMIIIATGGGQI
jgi:uncharacterized protein YkwD